jgi:carboxypeptidase Taq
MTTIDRLYQLLHEMHTLNSISAALDWDQQVNLPHKGAAERSEQIAMMQTILHAKRTDPQFIEVVKELRDRGDLSFEDVVNVRETWRITEKELKLPAAFVEESAKLASQCYHEWTAARPANDFARVEPLLERLFALAQQKADLVGYDENPYDALLDYYEPYGKLSHIKPLLLELATKLSALLPAILDKQQPIAPLREPIALDAQHALCQKLCSAIGYDFESGRLDRAPHPFCTSLGAHDIRITTRYAEDNYLSGMFTALHEAGHALYEDGLPKKWVGTPMGSAVSLGIHESQSRLWENIIGRSRPFAKYLHSLIGEFLPELHKSTSPDEIWAHTNHIQRSLIRVEADEVTYSLHVVIRMQLEAALLNKELSVRDLPAAWNELYRKFIGLQPPSDSDGVLQDVHWYNGLIGYFPTYALGNLYGAMMYESIRSALPTLDSDVERGDFSSLLQWLNRNVHQHGMAFAGPELIQRIAGRPLSTDSFITYVRQKFDV